MTSKVYSALYDTFVHKLNEQYLKDNHIAKGTVFKIGSHRTEYELDEFVVSDIAGELWLSYHIKGRESHHLSTYCYPEELTIISYE
jgi:hypothetical protein